MRESRSSIPNVFAPAWAHLAETAGLGRSRSCVSSVSLLSFTQVGKCRCCRAGANPGGSRHHAIFSAAARRDYLRTSTSDLFDSARDRLMARGPVPDYRIDESEVFGRPDAFAIDQMFFTRRWKPPCPHSRRDEALNDLPECNKIRQKKRRAEGVCPCPAYRCTASLAGYRSTSGGL